MNPDEDAHSCFRDELDPTVRTALDDMLSQSPEETRLEAAMERLCRSSRPLRSTNGLATQGRRWRLRIAVAASFLFCVLWFGAQTETWGRVTHDFQHLSVREPAGAPAETPDAQVIDRDASVSPWLRFVLILHVFSLLTGLVGMFASWLCSVWYWIVAAWRLTNGHRPRTSWCQRVHLCALVAYGVGIALGCVWAQAAWGGVWRWDPREAFALITLGIGMIWYTSNKVSCLGDPIEQAICEAFVASLAFWLIALLYILAVVYAPGGQSYGFPSPVPTIVLCLFGVNLLLLLASCLSKRWRRRLPTTHDAA